jgi:hypothetical protein
MDIYTVEFRIEDVSLIPAEITKVLKLSPSQVREGNNVNHKPLWAYDGISTEDNFIEQEWKTLEEGLLFVLDRLEPKFDLIQSDFFMYKRYFWCAHFQESFSGGAVFSTHLLQRLAKFNTELIIKNYYSE